ncbi:MAG: hypothetical protein LBU32_08245 [Clostridiales bacterium]|nr:hypothetical protein [Clostridiales bacterium]
MRNAQRTRGLANLRSPPSPWRTEHGWSSAASVARPAAPPIGITLSRIDSNELLEKLGVFFAEKI